MLRVSDKHGFNKKRADGGLPPISVTYSANENQADLFTKCGSPVVASAVTCTINSGVHLYSTSNATPAFTVTGFPVGTTILIINNGQVIGKGGVGGTGHPGSPPTAEAGSGTAGGDAMEIDQEVTITNGSGNIWGGGGGGGGGGYTGPGNESSVEGGGGGGGASSDQSPSPGGAAGSGAGPGHGGNAGAEPGGGSGGPGEPFNEPAPSPEGSPTPFTGSTGGAGGSHGNAGSVGGGPSDRRGAAGAAGKAIETNGNTVNWNSGSSSPNVEGTVG